MVLSSYGPAITTVVQPAYDIGSRAADILIDRVEKGGSKGQAITVRLPATLKVRDSSRSRAAASLSKPNALNC